MSKRDLNTVQRFYRKILSPKLPLAPDRIGTDGAGALTARHRRDALGAGLLPLASIPYATKHLQQELKATTSE